MADRSRNPLAAHAGRWSIVCALTVVALVALARGERGGVEPYPPSPTSDAGAAEIVACALLLVGLIAWAGSKLRDARNELRAAVADHERALRDLDAASRERARLQRETEEESERRRSAEASARLAAISEESVQRSLEEVLDTLDGQLSVVLDRVLEDAHDAGRKDLSASERRRRLDRIARYGESANDVLGELVDLRRLQRGQLSVHRTSVPIGALLERLREWAEPLAEARSQRFDLEIEGEMPARVDTDSRRLLRILKLAVRRTMDPEGGGRIRLLVQLEPGSVERLRFTLTREVVARSRSRVEPAARATTPISPDLDLAVAESIAEQLGGALQCERWNGGGLRHVLRIAIQGPNAPAPREPAPKRERERERERAPRVRSRAASSESTEPRAKRGASEETPRAPMPRTEPASETGAAIRSLLAGEQDMTELIDWFVEELAKDVQRIETALDAADRTQLASIAHQLKGAAGSYGFPALSEQADRVESAIAREEAADRVQREVHALLALCRRVEGP